MKARILKYQLNYCGVVSLPDRPIKVAIQKGQPHAWCEVVENDEWRIPHDVCIVATGEDYDDDEWSYVETFFDGDYVWHLLSRLNEDK